MLAAPSSPPEKSQPSPLTSSARNFPALTFSRIKLRPRSGSNVAGFSTAPSLAPRYSIDEPLKSSVSPPGSPCNKAIVLPSKMSPPTSTSTSGSRSSSSPDSATRTKKQKTQDLLKPTLRMNAYPPNDGSHGSRDEGSNITTAVDGGMATAEEFPSTPPVVDSGRKRPLPVGGGNTAETELSSPFAQGRQMMQSLCIYSPSSKFSLSPDGKVTDSRSRPVRGQYHPQPRARTLSSSSSKMEKGGGISSSMKSMARPCSVDWPGASPVNSNRVPHSAMASSSNFPFQSLLGQRASIGNQRGSVFQMPPQRKHCLSSRYMSSSPNGNTLAGASCYYPSPSRTVPLTVIPRDGSAVKTPNNMLGLYGPSSTLPSPLIRLIDKEKVEEEAHEVDSDSTDPDMPVLSVESSRESNESHRILPNLAPRTSPSYSGDTRLTRSRFMHCSSGAPRPLLPFQLPSFSQPKEAPRSMFNSVSSLVRDKNCPRLKATAEKGLECQNSTNDSEDPNQESKYKYTLKPLQRPTLEHFPLRTTREKSRELRNASPDDNSAHFSRGDKPMPLITFGLRSSGQSSHSSNMFDRTKPSFLTSQTNGLDPIERIIRADAIAEAAKSEEPLTDDDDNDIDGDDTDFFLCLPRENQASKINPKTSTKKYWLKSTHVSFVAQPPSPSLLVLPNSENFSKHCASLASLPTPASQGCIQLNKCETSDETSSTFISVDGDTSDTKISQKYSCTKATCATNDRQFACSTLSSSSLRGLDILHEGKQIHPMPSQSKSSEYQVASTGMFKSLPSELSLNSLGLSEDSTVAGRSGQDLRPPPAMMGLLTNRQISPRDLCTPPVVGATVQQMLSPPPLQVRATTTVSCHTLPSWN